MKKEIVGILSVIILVLPIQSVIGTNQIIKNPDELKTNLQDIDAEIIAMLNNVNESLLTYYLEKFVAFGTKKVGSENCKKTAEWIHQEFENLGLYTYFDNWRFPRYRDRNVLALINGTDPTSDAVIVICAHYDTSGNYDGSQNSPGANDDGSGIAAMLTIANITSKHSFNHTIRFVAVSGEEYGTYGSFADAKKAYNEGKNIISVINLDMIGYTNSSQDGKYIHIAGPERSKSLIDLSFEIAELYKEQINLEIVPFINAPVDHRSYTDYGYDGVWFAHLNLLQYYPDHTPNDTIDKINFTYLSKATKLILAITATQATKPIDIQVRIIKPYEGYIYLKNIPLVKLHCSNIWRMKVRAVTYIIGKTTVKVNITTDETISNVYFSVDGWIKHVADKPPYEYRIGKGNLDRYFKLHKGYHRITVSVITDNGKTATDEMDIFVLKLL